MTENHDATRKIQQKTRAVLESMAKRLRETPSTQSLAAKLDRLASEVELPCVVAVVGRMKAGKSTFINALLDVDLAVTGPTETTATVNYLAYGDYDPAHPRIRVHYRNDVAEDATKEFADSLQGHDVETLQRAEAISHLEYMLRAPELANVTIVDTPGTNAAVAEHQRRTEEILTPDHRRLLESRCERNAVETSQTAATADAVIYLTGAVAYDDERKMLDAFHQTLGGRGNCLNAIGVLGKVDMAEDLVQRRLEMANRIAGHLKDQLNTVVPVSAALHRVVTRISAAPADTPGSLGRLLPELRAVPRETLDLLTSQDSIFLKEELSGCTLSAARRRELYQELGRCAGMDLDWGVFATIVREVVRDDAPLPKVTERLLEIAGFRPLREILERYFFRRSRVLRCFRTAQTAKERVVNCLRFDMLDEADRQAVQERKTLEQFIGLIRGSHGDRATADRLEEFVRSRLDPNLQRRQITEAHAAVEKELEELLFVLENHNQDFAAAQELLAHPSEFSPAELEELQWLLGVKVWDMNERVAGLKTSQEHAGERQSYWRLETDHYASRNSARRRVAERAEKVYGHIYSKYHKRNGKQA